MMPPLQTLLDLASTINRTHRWIPLVLALCLCSSVSPSLWADTLVVDTLDDIDLGDGSCSLREAIIAANTNLTYQDCPAGQGDDVIEIPLNGTLYLQDSLPTITATLSIVGPGPENLVLSGALTYRIFHFDSPSGNQEFFLFGMQLLEGFSAERGGAIFLDQGDSLTLEWVEIAECFSLGVGGGVSVVHADLHLREVYVKENSSTVDGGGIHLFGGALTVVDSTFYSNHAGVIAPIQLSAQGSPEFGNADFDGGAIHTKVSTSTNLLRTTLSANTATGSGGGAFLSGGEQTIISGTFTKNHADTNLNGFGDGGGLAFLLVEVTLLNTLVAENLDNPDMGSFEPDLGFIGGPSVQSLGFNFVGNNAGASSAFPDPTAPGTPNVNGDLVGTEIEPLDPLLRVLVYNGGWTPTHLPLPGSPVVDHGSCLGSPHDQRGYGDPQLHRREVDDPAVVDYVYPCDIGAVETLGELVPESIFEDGFESGDLSAWSSVP